MDKFICEICGYSMVIQKSTTTNFVKISTPKEFIDAIKREEQDLDIHLNRADLEKYLAEKVKDKKKSAEILDLYDNTDKQTNRSGLKYVLKCTSSCNHISPLKSGTTIYSLNYKKQQSSFNDNNIDLKLFDPTLPRTKDYVCENPECETNNKGFNMANKEAVFYRAKDSYHTKYACLNCRHSWAI
jgi:hypothetical protein